MADDSMYQAARERQKRLKAEAIKATIFRDALSLNDKKARFPGFHQRNVVYKAGQQVVAGALTLPIDILLHESTATTLTDGTTLYSDIFLPDHSTTPKQKYPAIVAWSPYGKQRGQQLLDDFPGRAGVPRHWLSGLEKWEGPDPAFWCANDYAIVNVDSRGAYTSDGDLLMFGHQEAEDGAEFVTWVSEQSWCSGKVALAGNSWLAMVQWKIASLRPKGLAAIAPWEGFFDYFRQHISAGGIPFVGFHEEIAKGLASKGRLEDLSKYLSQNGTWDSYWEDKMAHPEWINVPSYVVASWTNAVHTPGTFKAFDIIPKSTPKWLRVHNKQEWPDFYDDNSQRDLKRFFDFYLHDRKDNGWEETPKVRISVLHFGLTDREDTVNRPEAEFPLPRTNYTKYYLQGDKTLSRSSSASDQILNYNSEGGKLVFTFQMPTACETTGYFMAHLLMSSDQHSEIDVFVQVEKLSPAKWKQGTMCIKPSNVAVRRLLKFMHDWQIGMGGAGMAMGWGPDGQLRASFALEKDDANCKVAQPAYRFREKMPLKKSEVRALDVPMRPYGLYWEKGDYLQFTIQGSMVIPFPIPGLQTHHTDNHGDHIVHCGGRGEDSSYLLVPHV